jgi:hypothetical protein
VKVREIMDRFKEGATTEERKLYIASLLAPPKEDSSQSNGNSTLTAATDLQNQPLYWEETRCESVYCVDAPIATPCLTTTTDGSETAGETVINGGDQSDGDTSMSAGRGTVEKEGKLGYTVGSRGGVGSRGRGRGRSLVSFDDAAGVNGASIGKNIYIGITDRVAGVGLGMGRGRGRQSFKAADNYSSIGWEVSCLEQGWGTGNEISEISQISGALDEEQLCGVAEAGALREKELREALGIISGPTEGVLEMSNVSQLHDSFIQLTSTPTQRLPYDSQANYLDNSPARLYDASLSVVSDGLDACQGCKALQVSNERLNSVVAAMEIKITNLTQIVTDLAQRHTHSSFIRSSSKRSDEIFTDNRLMRVKAAAFVTGRPLSAHMCKQLVLNVYDNEPPSSFNSDDIKSINDHRGCRDAQHLTKWAVFEMFSLKELVGRNCLGSGHDTSAGMNADIKKPFDEFKMQTIKNGVFNLYPQTNDAMRKAVWMKCVEKVNTDVRYLFKVSMKKHEWLQLGF